MGPPCGLIGAAEIVLTDSRISFNRLSQPLLKHTYLQIRFEITAQLYSITSLN